MSKHVHGANVCASCWPMCKWLKLGIVVRGTPSQLTVTVRIDRSVSQFGKLDSGSSWELRQDWGLLRSNAVTFGRAGSYPVGKCASPEIVYRCAAFCCI